MSRSEGRKVMDYLLGKNRLEKVDATTAARSAATILERASARLATARSGVELGDTAGAFSLAYDTYRMAAEALLAVQGLRATGGGCGRHHSGGSA